MLIITVEIFPLIWVEKNKKNSMNNKVDTDTIRQLAYELHTPHLSRSPGATDNVCTYVFTYKCTAQYTKQFAEDPKEIHTGLNAYRVTGNMRSLKKYRE